MTKNRLEAFSDGVLAIIITIMVLEFKTPQGSTWEDLKPLLPKFLSYALSFIYVGIYWNNHHHMLHTVKKVNGKILWANLHLLFWLSLIPFITGWIGENHLAKLPMMLYGVVLFMSGLAYSILQKIIIKSEGKNSILSKAIGNSYKEKISIFCYLTSIGFAYFFPIVSLAIYILVSFMWFIPDKRIERFLEEENKNN
ncbi:TMEM175 family protein [Flavobacterium sp.]|jgi:uncharacterized membrane protein|uniref:TMEM175 family protein n=1 Tax=Flavobacterium sp. TaxID=239 RepID=UPI0037C0051B